MFKYCEGRRRVHLLMIPEQAGRAGFACCCWSWEHISVYLCHIMEMIGGGQILAILGLYSAHDNLKRDCFEHLNPLSYSAPTVFHGGSPRRV
jgi:hypothetical protein